MQQEVTTQTPYLDEIKSTLNTTKMMKELLEKRIELGLVEMKDKSEWEQNEMKINLIRTRGEIDVLVKIIAEKEEYFSKYVEQYEKDAVDMRANFETVYKKAMSLKETNKLLKHAIDNANWTIVNSREEYKVGYYKRLKKILSEINV